jgi:hypothetical protein
LQLQSFSGLYPIEFSRYNINAALDSFALLLPAAPRNPGADDAPKDILLYAAAKLCLSM